MKITKLKQFSETEFKALWSDGREGSIALRVLRDNCPCASCKGETVLLRTYVPPPANTATPGRYEVRGVEPVGGYALKFRWGDGHDLGLYSWDLLHTLCTFDQ